MATQEQIKNLVEGRHPEYQDRIGHWNFLEETYEGGREWFAKHIFQFVKEGDIEFSKRIARAYRFNHTKQVVDQVDKYLFKMEIARKSEDAPEQLGKFWAKSTRSGLDMDTFAKRISNATSQYGRVWVIVDTTAQAPETGAAPKSLKDQAEAGDEIYAYIVRPQDMLDMSYDEIGKLNWCLVREAVRDDADPLSGSRRSVKDRYRLWTRNSWTLFTYEEKRGGKRVYTIEDTGEHGLSEVPAIQADHIFSEEQYVAPGLIDDIAYQDRAVANYLSNLDAIIQDQTFSQLAMPAQGLLPGEDGADKLMEMGTKRVFLYNGEAGAVPFYLAPDPKQAELIIDAIAMIIGEIYHSVGLKGERTQDDNGAGSDASGVAKSYDFERVNSLLTAKARAMQVTELAIARLVCLYAGDSADDLAGLLAYPMEFDVRGVYDEFEIAARLQVLSAPDEVRREQMRALIEKLFPTASKKVRDELEVSLKDWPPELIAETGLGDSGKPGASNAKSSGARAAKAANTQKVAKELTA